jgi:hypothetical protein
MKKVCDHCGGGLKIEREDCFATWCAQCVRDDYMLLNRVGITDSNGSPIIYTSHSGEISLGIQINVDRMKAIPPKGSKPNMNGDIFPPLKVEVAETKTMELPHQSEPAFDFDKYNSTIPGWGHGYR